jgi:hypothetical protein
MYSVQDTYPLELQNLLYLCGIYPIDKGRLPQPIGPSSGVLITSRCAGLDGPQLFDGPQFCITGASTGLFDFVMDPNTSAGLNSGISMLFLKAHACLVALACFVSTWFRLPVSSSIPRTELKNWPELFFSSGAFGSHGSLVVELEKPSTFLLFSPKKNSLISKRTISNSLVNVSDRFKFTKLCFCRLQW